MPTDRAARAAEVDGESVRRHRLPAEAPELEAATRAGGAWVAASIGPIGPKPRIAEPKIEAKIESQPPPKSDGPPSLRAVSPLAVSNGISGRTPFQEAVEKARSPSRRAPGSPGEEERQSQART